MSFFTRKPNPVVPSILQKVFTPSPAAANKGHGQRVASGSVGSMSNAAGPAGQAQQAFKSVDVEQAPSNQRFRSFAERYVIERCRDWSQGEIDERAWAAVLEARSIYNKVKEVGRTLGSDT